MKKKTYLGVEFGSTRIKAVLTDENHAQVASSGYTWQSRFEGGLWTYDLSEAWRGLEAVLAEIPERENIEAMGISGMMHGYLAFDEDWNLLVPFRTWQNTVTGEASEELTALFGFNVPQRWSIAHLYQAILNNEPHVSKIAHITTLAGYLHFMLTGENVVGVGEASGMFPIDPETKDYDELMISKFEKLPAVKILSRKPKDLLPKPLSAGECAGRLTGKGAEILGGLLPEGLPFAPPEGDAGTGMTASDAVAPRTGNVSAGTSVFAMLVLEKPLSRVYPEIDTVTTPAGLPVAMVHCNNCTADMNAWVALFGEILELFGASPKKDALFSRLYEKSSEGDPDCGGVTVCNYLAGEGVTHFDSGLPLIARTPGARFGAANFLRAQLYSSMVTLKIGMDILAKENVKPEKIVGHGGLFKTPGVGQRYLAAAIGAPVTCMKTAGEGGPYGMALLASYMMEKDPSESLEDYLDSRVFSGAEGSVVLPRKEDEEGFSVYTERFEKFLRVERSALEAFSDIKSEKPGKTASYGQVSEI